MRSEGFYVNEKSTDTSWDRTSDLPICSTVLPRSQWVQDPNESSVDNLNNVRRETSRHFMYKKKEYLKAKIDELDQKYQRLV